MTIKVRRKKSSNLKKSITLATFVKNEAHCIEHMFESVKDFCSELVVVDTGSTDGTQDIVRKWGARLYEVGFTNFGNIRTLTAHLSRGQWVLMLDADETISNPDKLQEMITKIDPRGFLPHAIALPRKRWLDKKMTQQTEIKAYPDWQVRLFENNPKFIFRRALHEEFHGGTPTHIENLAYINHFQDVFKDAEANRIRQELYNKLAPIAGVTLHGGKVLNND